MPSRAPCAILSSVPRRLREIVLLGTTPVCRPCPAVRMRVHCACGCHDNGSMHATYVHHCQSLVTSDDAMLNIGAGPQSPGKGWSSMTSATLKCKDSCRANSGPLSRPTRDVARGGHLRATSRESATLEAHLALLRCSLVSSASRCLRRLSGPPAQAVLLRALRSCALTRAIPVSPHNPTQPPTPPCAASSRLAAIS